MLTEFWERWRGYDRWIETEARIESSRIDPSPHTDPGRRATTSFAAGDELVWIDQYGRRQRAEFTVPDESPLYQLVGGEAVTIRYNPDHPEHFYYRALLLTRVRTALKRIAIAGSLIGLLLVGLWSRG